MWFVRHNDLANVVARPEGLASRIASVGWVVWFYLYKIAVPVNLAMVYPRWDVDGGRIVVCAPGMFDALPGGVLVVSQVLRERGWPPQDRS